MIVDDAVEAPSSQVAALRVKSRNPLIVLPWTFGIYLLVFMNQYVYFWLGSRATGSSFGAMAEGKVETPLALLLQGAVGVVLGIPILLLAARFLWRRSWGWLCLRFRPKNLAGGAALGAAAALVAVSTLAALGCAKIVGWPSRFALTDLGAVLAGCGLWAFFIATLEETVFRGMVTRELALRWGWPAAAVAGGLYFAAVHLIGIARMLTPALILGILAAGLAASALFVALYVRSRSLWLPIGFHAGWNFALSGILGTTMSGRPRGLGLFEVELSGPTVLTGGAFGLEMSIVSIVLMLAAAAIALRPWRGGAPVILPDGRETRV